MTPRGIARVRKVDGWWVIRCTHPGCLYIENWKNHKFAVKWAAWHAERHCG